MTHSQDYFTKQAVHISCKEMLSNALTLQHTPITIHCCHGSCLFCMQTVLTTLSLRPRLARSEDTMLAVSSSKGYRK